MRRLPRFLNETRVLVRLAAPLVLSQLSYVLMGLLDTVMSGRAGAQEQAVVGLGVAMWIPILLALMGVVQSVSPLVAHHFGAGNHAGIVTDTREGLWLAALCGLLPLALMPAVPWVLHAFQIPPALAEKTRIFLWGIALGLPAGLLMRTLGFYSSSINHTRPLVALAFVGVASNALLNWVLIFGHWGAPAMGGAGCGWATGIGMWLALLLMVAYTAWAPAYQSCRVWRGWRRPHWAVQKKLLRLGLPIGLTMLAEVVAFTGVALLIGRFGAVAIAAHQVALNFASLVFMVPLGLASALTIRVGQRLGAGDAAGARFSAWTGVALGMLIACVTGPLIVAMRGALVALYTDDLAVQQTAMRLMLFNAVWQLSDATQVCAVGALRGYHVTLPPLLVMLLAYWLVGIPLGVWLGYGGGPFGAPLGVYGFWGGLVVGLAIVALSTAWILRRVARREALR